MKNKILYGLAVLAIAAAAAWNMNFSDSQTKGMSDLALANIEALADDEGSNNNGGNPFYYEHLLGQPKECTLYKYFNGNGSVHYDESGELELGAGWTVINVKGVKELCPKSGNGCTVYSCQETNN